MKTFFSDLFQYNASVDERLSSLFASSPGTAAANSRQLFSHMLNAHHIWNHRIIGQPPTYGVWQFQPVPALRPISEANHALTSKILAESELNMPVSYQNTRGESFQNTIRDVLFHILNHSTYHRGQIAKGLKESGIDAINTDYISYVRTQGTKFA